MNNKRNELIADYYTTHRDELLAYASSRLGASYLVEDIVQDVFTRLLDSDKMISMTTLPCLVYTVTRNLIADHYRRRRCYEEYEHYLQHSVGTSAPLESVISAQELTERMERSLARLPEKCGQVYRLHIYSGMRVGEISRYLGESYKSVEHRLCTARKHVRQCLMAG